MTETHVPKPNAQNRSAVLFQRFFGWGSSFTGGLQGHQALTTKKGCEMQSTFKEVHEHSPCLHSKTSFFKSETSGYLTGTPGCTVLPAREGSLRLQCPFQAQALFHCRWLMIHQCFSSFSKLHQLSYPGVWPATSALYPTQCSQQT